MKKYPIIKYFIFCLVLSSVTQLFGQNNSLDVDVEQNKEIEALNKKIAELEKIIKSFENPTDDLEKEKRQNRRKFSDLEQTITQLQNQVKELHSNQKSNRQGTSNSAIQYSNKWEKISNWRQLKKDMSSTQVVIILGEPIKVDASLRNRTYWIYSQNQYGSRESYVFFEDNRVIGWREPNL